MTPTAPGTEIREPPRDLVTPAGRSVPAVTHPDWAERFPWLVQGTTTRGTATDPFDMGLAGTQPVAAALSRWWALREAGFALTAVVARQVHGPEIRVHDDAVPGLQLMPPADGHHTKRSGILLAVTVADCVPVSIVSAGPRSITLLHAGWRGAAAGILEAGLALAAGTAGGADRLHVHFGPAICGGCYEVGPEVHEALGLRVPANPAPVDLRAILAGRARESGVPAAQVTRSAWCTRCDNDRFFSHRVGDPGRQVGFLAIRRDA